MRTYADYDFVPLGNRQVLVTTGKLNRFAETWPCSGLRGTKFGIIFSYQSNGDLVDIEWFDGETGLTVSEPESIDGAAILALSHDAQLPAFDPFYDCKPCHVEPYACILDMYFHGALETGETL